MNKIYTDYKGKRPISGLMLVDRVKNGDLLSAWWIVATYIMKMNLQPMHIKMMKHQYDNKKSLTMAGRGYGKSYTNNTAFTLTLILRDPHIRIAVATQSQDQSKKFINELKKYFDKGTVIYELFGDLKGGIWQETQFELKRERIIKEATVTAGSMGASSSFISSHFDVLILDDVVGEENAQTKGQRDKLKNFIFNTVFPTLESQNGYGWMHCIGTHYHQDDFWITIENSKQFNVLKLRSLIKKDGIEKSIWEEKKGIEELRNARELFGSRIFNMQYQQKVESGKGSIFKGEWLQRFSNYYIEKGRVTVEVLDKNENEIKEEVAVYGGVDLAISQRASADSFVICIIGIGRNTGNTYLLDMYRGKLSFGEQMEKIKEYGAKWDMIIRIGIESVAYQQALPDELIRTTFLPITKMHTLTDKVTRMNKFSGQWENYKVFMYNHIPNLHILEDETLDFPNAEHDDTIDAFEIAWSTAGKKKEASVPGFNVAKAFGFM